MKKSLKTILMLEKEGSCIKIPIISQYNFFGIRTLLIAIYLIIYLLLYIFTINSFYSFLLKKLIFHTKIREK